MLIPNTLRMEHMPKMVYVLIKLINSGEYTSEDLRKRITASMCQEYEDVSRDRFNLLLTFACAGELITEENGFYKTEFKENELISFDEFAYSLLGKMSSATDNMFNALLRYYLSTSNFEESEFSSSAEKFRIKAIENAEVKKYNVEEDSIHGFLFWIEAFQIANFEGNRTGHVYFAIENLLMKYLEKHPEIKNAGSMPVREFLDRLQQDIYFIPFCCESDRNGITYPMAQALRILENMDMIQLEYRQDSDQMWHLPASFVFSSGNTFTNVRVL